MCQSPLSTIPLLWFSTQCSPHPSQVWAGHPRVPPTSAPGLWLHHDPTQSRETKLQTGMEPLVQTRVGTGDTFTSGGPFSVTLPLGADLTTSLCSVSSAHCHHFPPFTVPEHFQGQDSAAASNNTPLIWGLLSKPPGTGSPGHKALLIPFHPHGPHQEQSHFPPAPGRTLTVR